jgi:hypothetical protein
MAGAAFGTTGSCAALGGEGSGARPLSNAVVIARSSLQSSGAVPTSMVVCGCWSCGGGAIPVAPR